MARTLVAGENVNSTPGRCDCKVGRVTDALNLEGMNEELAARRRGDEGRPASLRLLADYFNREVLRVAIERAGGTPLEGEVENLFRLLTDNDVSSGTVTRARKQLEAEGVDIETVERSFVSHPTMGKHLEQCLDVQPPPSSRDRIETAKERVFKMLGRTEAVVQNTLDGLASAGALGAGTLLVTVDVQVICEDCGVNGGIESFIDRGGCDCRRAAEE